MLKKSIFITLALTIVWMGVSFANHIVLPKASEFKLVNSTSKEFKEIKALFDSLVAEAKKGNVEGIVSKYSVHLEPDRDVTELKNKWKELFNNYRDVEISLPIYNVEVYGNLARVRCDRAILAAPGGNGQDQGYELVDAQHFMVYNLIKENGQWKILGGELPLSGEMPDLL